MSASATTLNHAATIDGYADRDVERRLTRSVAGGTEAFFLLDGIRCGACALAIERALQGLSGVVEAEVNFATHRARAVWDPDKLRLVDVLGAIERAGYSARPYDAAKTDARLLSERRDRLYRLGVAGLFGMQVMTISIALYAGEFYGMDAGLRQLLRWLALVLTLPVIAYAGMTFFSKALRDLRRARPGMDVPVSLGLLIAFGGSVYATVRAEGDVYFDSVVMFVFFLLLARYFEFSARARHARVAESLVTAPPATAMRIQTRNGMRHETPVVASALAPGDRIYVASGDTIPADGVVEHGATTVDESILTGESRPVEKSAGEEVIAGSLNRENPVEIRVTRAAKNSTLEQTLRLMERARQIKPRTIQLADRVAARFVSVVLVLAVAVAVYWWHTAPGEWLAVTVSVLVVTCPCALSLATPAAFTAAVGALARRGLVVARGHALERLATITRFVFDKTGTLTRGRLRLAAVRLHADLDEETVLRLAASLERGAGHPIGRAFPAHNTAPVWTAGDVKVTPGAGIEAFINGRRYAIGSPAFISARIDPGGRPDYTETAGDTATCVLLADENKVLASIFLSDCLRPDAFALTERLRRGGIRISLLSGDRPQTAKAIGALLKIDDAHGALGPKDKLARLQAMQNRGEVVAMAGDGINDAPVLAGADVSIAMGSGPRAAQASADLILLSDRLEDVAAGVTIARRTRRIVIQNLAWATGYNLLALPAAALGLVPPWLAALGMSLSSMVVVANGLRAGRVPD
jgi:Cu2+-exporting ATPase